MKFVCSSFYDMPVELMAFSRLYAYPRLTHPPPSDGFVLLDSGAFALSMQGKKIDDKHMEKLALHYSACLSEHVYAIAPDVYPNPQLTMKNWTTWQSRFSIPVIPVIQMPAKKTIDLTSAIRQIKFYSEYAKAIPKYQDKFLISISNPGLRGCEARDLSHITTWVRSIIGSSWIHVLGAGWGLKDICDWRALNSFDSLDTIAYYTDAKRGVHWGENGLKKKSDWVKVAIENAKLANR